MIDDHDVSVGNGAVGQGKGHTGITVESGVAGGDLTSHSVECDAGAFVGGLSHHTACTIANFACAGGHNATGAAGCDVSRG